MRVETVPDPVVEEDTDVLIRVTSSGFDILERPRHPPPPPKYWIEHYYYENSVRTCSGWAPRG